MAPAMQAGSEDGEETQGEREFEMENGKEKMKKTVCSSPSPFLLCLSLFVCTPQHRRLSEASLSPPGSSIGSPSRVICVSSL